MSRLKPFLFLAATFVVLVGAGMFRGMAPLAYQSLAWGVVSSIALLALSFAFLRWDKRDAAGVGLQIVASSWKRFFAGLGIGFLLHGVQTAAVMAFARGAKLERVVPSADQNIAASVVLAMFTFLALSCMEELGFRGYALRRLDELWGRPAALAIGAVAFVLLHLAYGWPLAAAVVGVSTGALLFGLAALVSGGLAVPIGVHFAWNWYGWFIGEKDTPGIWRFVVSEADTPRAQTIGLFPT